MKNKLIKGLLLLVMMCMSYTVVYAETMQLIYDGGAHLYYNNPITLYIDGNQIITTVMPPIQFDGAVVVPAREVFSVTGATVEWRPSEQSVYVHNETRLIVLKINSNEAWVDGETKYLDMPAKLINDKVMIPVRFISETLGYTVDWSQTERAIRIETIEKDMNSDQFNDINPDYTDIDESEIPIIDDNDADNDLQIDISQLDPWLYSEYIHYKSENEALVLNNIEGLEAKNITVEENYHEKNIVIHLNNQYSSYLQAGTWEKATGAIKRLQITHQALETQIILTTSTIQALTIENKGNQIVMKVVSPPSKYNKIVVVDAGHGAHDPGTTYLGLKEKDLTLSISQAVIAQLEADPNIKVYATREDDTFLELMERSNFSNEIQPDLFISIHINSVDGNGAASGTETYYTEKADTRNKAFATIVQNALVKEFGTRNRGVKANTFVVTRYTKAPAILIEIGFLTNESDRTMMTASDFTARYARTIYECVLEYYAKGYHLQ